MISLLARCARGEGSLKEDWNERPLFATKVPLERRGREGEESYPGPQYDPRPSPNALLLRGFLDFTRCSLLKKFRPKDRPRPYYKVSDGIREGDVPGT